MAFTPIQSSCQFGEVSRLMRARVESPIYYHSLKRLRNMVVIPQGGAKSRFGLSYVDSVNTHAGIPVYLTDYRKVQLYLFDYQDDERYLLCFRDSAVDVYFNDVYQSTTSTTYTADQIATLSITQSASIVFIAHPSHPPRTLTRSGAGPIVLTLTTPQFIEYPTFDFVQSYDSYNFQFQYNNAGTWQTLIVEHNVLGAVVRCVCSANLFTTDYIGGLFQGEGGTVRLTSYVDQKTMEGRIVSTFDAASSLFTSVSSPAHSIAGADCIVSETAFNNNRGWPGKVAFYQNRLFFGSTASLLGGLWGSNYNGYSFDKLHFDDSSDLATNAISTILQGNGRSTVIKHIVEFKSLLIFTTSGTYSTPLLTETPLTPDNVNFLNLQTSDAVDDVRPVVFDNDVVFFSKGGRKVKSVNVYATTQHYETRNISVLAPHLVDQPYSAAVYQNSDVTDGNWLFMTNNGTSIDGGLSIYQSVPEQEIAAWSLSTPANTAAGKGYFRQVVSDQEVSYFLIEREVDGQTRLFIERLNFDICMDAAKIGTPTSVPGSIVTGLDYLNGETVKVIGDGGIMQDRVVTDGTIALEYDVSSVVVGLGWTFEWVPQPVNINLQSGNNLYQPKSIKSLYLDFYESIGITVNGELIPPFQFEEDHFNEPPALKTDFVQIQPMLGWDPMAEVVVSNEFPIATTILGACFVVEA